MGLADLHIHTTHSLDGTATVRAVLKKTSQTGLDVIAITDHDVIDGALEALELAPAYGIQVIPGSEVSTANGHLLALFIRKKIRKGLRVEETLLEVAEQGGLCIAPHICGGKMNSLGEETLRRVMENAELARILVAVEVYNAGVIHQSRNEAARRMAMELPVAQVSNSDAHLLWMIGKGATFFAGKTDSDLRKALEVRETQARIIKSRSQVVLVTHLISRIILRYAAGLVTINNHPQAPLRFARQK